MASGTFDIKFDWIFGYWGNFVNDFSFVRGRTCRFDEAVDLHRAAVVVEIYSKSLTIHDKGLVASYFVAHDLDSEDAEKAMGYFASEPSLLVDTQRLVTDCGAEFPALVTVRFTDDTANYLSTMYEYGILRELPDDEVIRHEGWNMFWAFEALNSGLEVPEAAELPEYDYRELRRKIFAIRASTLDDRDPWLMEELKQLRTMTEGSPEGCEQFVARADDIDAALRGEVHLGEHFSVVIPTSIERKVYEGAIGDWVPQAGKEIVVAHGLDALQAARVLMLVKENPAAYVSEKQLLSGDGREHLQQPYVKPDRRLNWISTDFSGRRSHTGYQRLKANLNVAHGDGPVPDVQLENGR